MRIFTRQTTDRVAVGLAAILLSTNAYAQLSPENAISCDEGVMVPIAYGDHTIGCEIDYETDLDLFVFQGTAGDEVRIVFRGFSAVLELRDPFNSPLPDGGDGVNEWILPETGAYQLRVFDDQFDYTGSYRFQMERTSPILWGVGISHDDNPWADKIDPGMDTDWLAFKGRSGTEVRLIVVGRTGAGFGPSIEVLSPDGATLGVGGCGGGTEPCSFYRDFDLTQDGTHYVQFREEVFGDIGDYEISLQCLFGDCPLGYYIRSVGFISPTELGWEPTSDPDATYDVVRGDLHILRGSDGDFSSAVIECTSSGNILPFADVLNDPDPSEGFFYVVRALQGAVGPGSYDTGRASQASRYGGRDLGPLSINSSSNACPGMPSALIFDPDVPPGNVHMAAGEVDGSSFDIEIRVADVADFYGAAFHVSFDPDSVEFLSFDSTGSFLLGQSAGTYVNAAAVVPGEVAVAASLLGQVAGVPTANGLLLTLRFVATATTPANLFTFAPETSRQVTVCPTAGGTCTDIAGALIWTGGTLTSP